MVVTLWRLNSTHVLQAKNSYPGWELSKVLLPKAEILYWQFINCSASTEKHSNTVFLCIRSMFCSNSSWSSDNAGWNHTIWGLRLSILATYSKPDVRKSCNAFSCRVTCESYGGYPSKRMMWDIPGSSMWEEVNSSERGEPNTTMYSSSTALFNCSGVELKYLRCYVGPIKSDFFSVCESKKPVLTFLRPILCWLCLGKCKSNWKTLSCPLMATLSEMFEGNFWDFWSNA